MKIIHLSDIHIGKSKNTDRFISIISWIITNKDMHGSKVVVLTGDIVDDGHEKQYPHHMPHREPALTHTRL